MRAYISSLLCCKVLLIMLCDCALKPKKPISFFKNLRFLPALDYTDIWTSMLKLYLGLSVLGVTRYFSAAENSARKARNITSAAEKSSRCL